MSDQGAEQVRADVRKLPPVGGEVYVYSFDARDDEDMMRALASACRARHWLVIGCSHDSGNGHRWYRVGPRGEPRTCSGTRGRGRRKAAHTRRRRRGYKVEVTILTSYGEAALAGNLGLMTIPVMRAMRGPKGARLLPWVRYWYPQRDPAIGCTPPPCPPKPTRA